MALGPFIFGIRHKSNQRSPVYRYDVKHRYILRVRTKTKWSLIDSFVCAVCTYRTWVNGRRLLLSTICRHLSSPSCRWWLMKRRCSNRCNMTRLISCDWLYTKFGVNGSNDHFCYHNYRTVVVLYCSTGIVGEWKQLPSFFACCSKTLNQAGTRKSHHHHRVFLCGNGVGCHACKLG